MKLFSEDDILDADIRKKVIAEILGQENISRKADAFKRYNLLKDRTKDYVYEKLRKEMGEKTALEMIHRTPNISIFRQIVEKKANVYKDGCTRVTKRNDQAKLDELCNELKLNTNMKKANKYVEAFKNAAMHIRPYYCQASEKYEIELNLLAPYLYDVIEDANSPEHALVYITSPYKPKSDMRYTEPNKSGYHTYSERLPTRGDGKDQIIADSPQDKGLDYMEFIWWTTKYHFTTNEKGEVITGIGKGDGENPIGELPFVSMSVDQDGNYWAIGGDDIADTSILVNLLLADLFYIAKFQGMGLLYMTGKQLPVEQKIGPSAAILIEQREGEPTPQIGFATSNPPISSHLEMIQKLLGFLLSTNNLGSGSADMTANAASGVQEMIQKSENLEDIEDQRQLYRDSEPEILEVAIKWLNLYSGLGLLEDDWSELGTLNPEMEIAIKFADSQPYISESEKLDIIVKRMEIGLDTMLDAIKKDNPSLSDREAKAKLAELLKVKAEAARENMATFMGANNGGEQDNQEDQANGFKSGGKQPIDGSENGTET